MAFAPGDVVFLKSGGSPMTVTAVGEDSVDCLWLGEEGELFRESIPSVALMIGMYVFGWTDNRSFPTLITFYLLCGVGAGVVTSLLTKPENTDRLDRFYLTINTPIGQEHKFEGMKEAA